MSTKALITAAEGFPALERLAASAQDELLLSFRIFDPATRLRAPQLRERGLETWSDLIAWIARRGVRIQFLIADFDPQFAGQLHRRAWACASGFADVVQGDAQILCAPHGQRAGVFWRVLMAGRLRRALRGFRQEDTTALTPVQRRVLQSGPELRPATVHQKFAIADGKSCLIGGLDVNERRFDTPAHDRPAEDTWHDVAVLIEDSDFCGALRAHFGDCWNAALDCGTQSLAARATRFDTSVIPQSRADLRLIRTISTPCAGAARLAPTPLVRDHESTLKRIISKARDYLYIETQFLRHKPLVDALCEAAKSTPQLQLIMLLPPAAERVLFGEDDSWNARHGHALQTRAIDRVTEHFGKRVAVVSPAQPYAAGREPIYLHSKVLIADDRLAMIGSANLNGRSMLWDSEASALIDNKAFAKDLLRRLSTKWLGEIETDPRLAVTWIAGADPKNPHARLMPYPQEDGRRFSKRMLFVPDAMF